MRILSPSLVSAGTPPRAQSTARNYLPLCDVSLRARARTGWIASRSRVSESTKHFLFEKHWTGMCCSTSANDNKTVVRNLATRKGALSNEWGEKRRERRGGHSAARSSVSLARRFLAPFLVRERRRNTYIHDDLRAGEITR